MTSDYYDLLRLTPVATFEEVHKAYRILAMEFHPDRNPTPDAASRMTEINEAFSVLSEPVRRRQYDQERRKTQPFDIAGPVLRAAHETLLKQGWSATQNTESALVLERDERAVRVALVARLDSSLLKKIGRQFPGFSVVLAVDIETPINLSLNAAIIDLMRSSHHGAPFPDDAYRQLFGPFL
ncbi:MAG TPA: J domain-containing protein [Terriglobia bacterium]|jgi:curved DNA-binding protein CbpA